MRLFPILLLACILTTTNATGADAPQTVATWERWEGRIDPTNEDKPIPADTKVDILYQGPQREEFRVPAVRAEGNSLLFRMAFPAPGRWRWIAKSEHAGFDGQTGEVLVTASTSHNPFYRCGDLRVSENRRYLMHADGTPFLWMGDTCWSAPWKATLDEWQFYIDTRAKQRFSVLQLVATGLFKTRNVSSASGHLPFNDNGGPNHKFWDDLETKIAMANDRGLLVMVTGLGNSPDGYGPQQNSEAFARFIAARLAGHMVVLSPSMDQRIDPQNDAAGERLKPLSRHLIAQHPGTHFPTALHYHDAVYTDVSSVQTGHHGGRLNQVYQAAVEWPLTLWNRQPTKPVINVEGMYDGLGNDDGPGWREQDVRKCGWLSWLSGARGYTYGAGDIPPKVPTGSGGIWRFNQNAESHDYWRKAIHWPSATQMTHLRDFFAAIDWWKVEPAHHRVRNQSAEPLHRMVASHIRDGSLVIAYLPDSSTIELDLDGVGPRWQAEWYNPATGKYIPALNTSNTFTRPDGWDDAVLKITSSP